MDVASTSVTTTDGRASTLLDLSEHRNNLSSTTVGNLGDGGLNIWRNSLPQEEMPANDLIQVEGVAFSLPHFDGVNLDNLQCQGQYLECPQGRFDWLYLLVTAERRCEDKIALHFADGSVDFEDIRVSDFWHGESAFGDVRAFGSTQMHYPFHVQPNLRGEVWFQRVPVSRMVALTGVSLPENVALHVYALTLVPTHLEPTDA